ncbi:hypothetical protein BP5796_05088 [Coleophoma crateriformis]|uniref:Uncharacterized protein n=1 Tax=Coleophoma crateriformis TaxID=565419 RepID=A0A3D8S2K4_9HELO|nr:hypothetical protein BP5796_05088 [Coleophoma crateriformis]
MGALRQAIISNSRYTLRASWIAVKRTMKTALRIALSTGMWHQPVEAVAGEFPNVEEVAAASSVQRDFMTIEHPDNAYT